MGKFYNPTEVEKLGSKVTAYGYSQPSLSGEDRLVAIFDNGVSKIAADVTDLKEWEHFNDLYKKGRWLTRKCYAISPEKLKRCPDIGEVSSTILSLVK